eukprot:TRINITY_DN2501_c0_g1_i2.p1 TRINITY_DN2501_c0_g1~~TRINITY_DN2501_c0_g1_i2.p1  ORF type:complete len:1658 (+),score=386.93 TRINITY_DN2501_c0_g1_i2:98-5071(+)
MDYEVFLVRLPGYSRPTRNISKLLRATEHGISLSTLSPSNPTTLEYSFENVTNVTVSQTDPAEFSFDVLEGSGNSINHNFVCNSRERLLTTLFNKLDDLNGIGTDFNVKKHSNRAGAFVDVVLRLRSTSLVKMVAAGVRHERRKASNMKKINLHDILKMETLGDDGRLILLHLKSRIWRLSLTKDALQFALAIQRNMKTYLNREMEIGRTTPSLVTEAANSRLQLLRSYPVLYEFSVVKGFDGGPGNQRDRSLVITTEHIAELAGGGEDLIGLQNLSDVLGLVVSDKNDTEVTLEFRDWRPTQYFIQERDSFVGSLAEVVGVKKGMHFSMRLEPFFPHTLPDKPLPLYQNECEIYMISRFMAVYNIYKEANQISSQRAQSVWLPLLKDYACNIHLGDSLLINAQPLYAVAEVLRSSLASKSSSGSSHAITCCIVLQRLLASRACFDSVKSNPDFTKLLLQTMQSSNSVVAYTAATTLRVCLKFAAADAPSGGGISFLGTPAGPGAAEAANKLVVLSGDNLQFLVSQLQTHSLLHQNALQVLGVLEILTLALELPPADAEAEKHWRQSFENALVSAAEVLCDLTRSRSSVIFRTNALLWKAALPKCSPPLANRLLSLARARCVVLVFLRNALFSKNERTRELSAQIVYTMWDSCQPTKAMLKGILPKGFIFLYEEKLEAMRPVAESAVQSGRFTNVRRSVDAGPDALQVRGPATPAMRSAAWLDTLDVLRTDSLSTPVLMWNDLKRQELLKFLREEVEVYDQASAAAVGREVDYNAYDSEVVYSAMSNNNEVVKTIVDGIHLETLLEGPDEDEPGVASHWQLQNPVQLFQAILHALIVCFTPLYGTSNLPEVEPRLAMDAMTWILERHYEELAPTLETLRVVETVVAMLREAIENEHHVFAFKSVFFLVLAVESGGRPTVLNFVKAGGMPTIIPLMVVALHKCCQDPTHFECDTGGVKERGVIEKVPQVGADGEVRMARVPHGRAATDSLMEARDDSMEARDAIKWQDDSVPDKVQLGMAMDLLEALLRLSSSENGTEQFPPAATCQDLTRHEILFHLVQMLLRAKAPFFGRILDMLVLLFKADRGAVPGLYKFGIYEILLWKLLCGDTNKEDKLAIVNFLWQTHLQQDSEGFQHSPLHGLVLVESLPWHESILRLHLPAGLIVKLIQEGPEGFLQKISSTEDSPEVIWSKEMRGQLVERLSQDLEPYVKARASDPQAVFIYKPKPALVYEELEESIFVAPFYLHNLLDVERFPDHPVVDPSAFHAAVLQEYQRILNPTTGSGPTSNTLWRQEVPRLEELSKAQALVVERYPHVSLPPEQESVMIDIASPALRVCIAQRDDCPAQITAILANCAQILRSIAQSRDKGESQMSEAAIHFALSVLNLGQKPKADGGFPDSCTGTSLEPAIAASLGMLEIAAATREGRHLLKDDVRWRKGFWWALCSAAGDAASKPEVPPSVSALAALDCLNHFAGDMELCYRVLKQGLLLPLLLLAVPNEEAMEKSRSRSRLAASSSDSDPNGRGGGGRLLEQVAAEVLRKLAVTLDQAPESDPSPRLQFERGILAGIVPVALLTSLKNPDAGAAKFMAMSSSDVEQPTAIWNKEVRRELREKVTARIRETNLRQAAGVLTSEDELKWLEEFRCALVAKASGTSGIAETE